MNKRDRFEVILEDINGKIDGIIEILVPLAKRVEVIDLRLERVETDVSIIKSVIREHSSDIAELKAQAHSH